MGSGRKICVGMIGSAHGVRGLVRLRSFTENPEDISGYGPLTDESGEHVFAVTVQSAAKDHFVAAVEGVTDREGADALRGTKLYVDRKALPKTRKREYYEADLVGLAARNGNNEDCGKVLGVGNYGGGPFLEIGHTSRDSFMLPFNDTCVPEVDIE